MFIELDCNEELMFEFVSSYKDLERELHTIGFKNACYGINESVVDSMLSYSVEHIEFEKPLESSIDTLRTMEDTDDLVVFYENLCSSFNLDARPITIGLQNTDLIEKMRSQYLILYSRELEKLFKSWMSGTIKDPDTNKIKEKVDSLTNKTRTQVVKTTMPSTEVFGIQRRDPDMHVVNTGFISDVIVPFVRNFNVTKNQLINEAQETLANVEALKSRVKLMVEASSKAQFEPEVSRKFQFFIFMVVKCSYELMAYTVAMNIQRISAYTYNMNTFCKLYNTIHNFYPEGSRILHESIIDNMIDDMDNTTLMNSMIYNDTMFLTPMIQQIIDRGQFEADHMTSYAISDESMNAINSYERDGDYDRNPYDQTLALLKIVNNAMRGLYEGSKDPNMTVDEIIKRAGANDGFSDKFTPLISSIPNTSVYTQNIDDYGNGNRLLAIKMIRTELANYQENLNKIAAACQAIYRNIGFMQKKYKYNINGEFGSTEQANELLEIMDEFEQQIKDISLNLIKAFIQRLKGLKSELDSINLLQETVTLPMAVRLDGPNYITEAYLSIIEEKEIYERAAFESLLMDYNAYRAKVDRGVVLVYESKNSRKNKNKNNQNNTSKNDGSKPNTSDNNQKDNNKANGQSGNNNSNANSSDNSKNDDGSKPNTSDNNQKDNNNKANDQSGNNNSNNTQNSDQNKSNSQENNNSDNKSSDSNGNENTSSNNDGSKPNTSDNNNDNSSDSKDNNSSNNNQNSDQKKENVILAALKKFKEFILSLIKKFKEKISNLQPKAKYMENHKSEILNKISDNTELTLSPYYVGVNSNIFLDDVLAFEKNIKALSGNDMYSKFNNAATFRDTMFNFIKVKQIGDYKMSDSFDKFLITYYSVGENADDMSKGRVVSGESLKKIMEKELEFVSGYEEQAKKIANTCSRIIEYIDAELNKSMNNQNTEGNNTSQQNDGQNNNNNSNNNQNTNESVNIPILRNAVLFEADNDNNNNNDGASNNSGGNLGSVEQKIAMLTGDVKKFETTILTVMEKRFMTISLISHDLINGQTKINRNANNNDNNNSNNSDQQNDNQQNNNNDNNQQQNNDNNNQQNNNNNNNSNNNQQ